MFAFRRIPTLSRQLPSLETFFESFSVDDETGRASIEHVSDFVSLPDPDSYDLQKMLKAGVPLQETRTNILASDLEPMLEDLDAKPLNEDKPNEQ